VLPYAKAFCTQTVTFIIIIIIKEAEDNANNWLESETTVTAVLTK